MSPFITVTPTAPGWINRAAGITALSSVSMANVVVKVKFRWTPSGDHSANGLPCRARLKFVPVNFSSRSDEPSIANPGVIELIEGVGTEDAPGGTIGDGDGTKVRRGSESHAAAWTTITRSNAARFISSPD